jgi:hypothetical protein
VPRTWPERCGSSPLLRASLALAVVATAAGLLPARASAHAGLIAPAATSYLARISSAPAGVEAKVVDGDQRLWLRVAASATVVVLGLRNEPYLRFSRLGVEVNTRSTTYFLNRARPQAPPAGLGPQTPPVWKRLTDGHSTSWHEDRLHALALASHSGGNSYIGRWLVPLVVNGRRAAIVGGLWHAARPSLLWFWPLALVLACVPALLRLREARLDVGVARLLAALALGAATAARLGRELYGRPTVSAGQLVLAGVTCTVALALAVLFLVREWRTLAGIAIGIAAAYQGLALVGTLRNGYVLAAIPDWAERTACIVSLAAGAALLFVLVVLPAAASEPEQELAVNR